MIYSIVHRLGNGGAEKQAKLFVEIDVENRILIETKYFSKADMQKNDRILVWTPISLLASRELFLYFCFNRKKFILGFRSSYRVKGRLKWIRLVQFLLFFYSPILLSNVPFESLYFPFNILPKKKFRFVRNIVENVTNVVIKEEELSFVYIGRLDVEKGLEDLIKIWDEKFPNLRIIGRGPLFEKTRKHNIIYEGYNESFWIEWEVSSTPVCVILPSRREEGVPNVVLEALARGLPAVLRDVKEHRVFPERLVSFCDFDSSSELAKLLFHIQNNFRDHVDERINWVDNWRIDSMNDLKKLNEEIR